jgi:CheY-like chemotaxis protein
VSDWRVLVVEDDPDGQEVLTRILRHHQIAVEVAPTAEEALAMLSQQRYSLVIVDLALPRLSGWELLKAIRTAPDTTELPCVAVTAFHSPEVAIKAIAAGFKAYFPKPVDATSFMRELQSSLS